MPHRGGLLILSESGRARKGRWTMAGTGTKAIMDRPRAPQAEEPSIRAFVSWAHAHAALAPETWSQRVFSFAVVLRTSKSIR